MEHRSTDEILSGWKKHLQHHGYRVTKPRQQVMRIIASSPSALTAQEIFEVSLQREQSPGIASVYRTVEMLEDLQLVQKVHKPGGCHGIYPAPEGHQHQLICRDCGEILVVPGSEKIADYLAKVEQQTGFIIEGHWLHLFGSCSACVQRNNQI